MSHRRNLKRKAAEMEAASNHTIFSNPSVRRVQFTVTSDAGSTSKTSILGRSRATSAYETLKESSSPPLKESATSEESATSNTKPQYEADGLTGSACTCGRTGMIASVQCYDCINYQLCCRTCFVESHIQNSFHWAEVWDFDRGFFVRHDISKLGHTIQLGHRGGPCTTTREPHTAFTISLLKEFQLHNLESKKAAYDYLAAIRRLSDNAFTADVPKFKNPYAAFLCVVRVFNFLTLRKRSGSQVRSHLNQSQRTLDGNFQYNQFNKNTDPNDISLCAGKGYFPIDSEYKEYLNKIPVSKEKSTCNYLKAVNKQDKRKFKNMAVTGTVNCQCTLERHQPNEDFKFTLRFEVEDIDEVTTYDIACEYKIHLVERFGKHFPHLVPKVKKMRWGVPALHVQGHQDSCSYLFGTAYMQCVGHFHGESAEQYWPESNQLGPHVRQMNNGHRQDTMINHHGDWNYKKTAQIAFDLAEEMKDARQKYLEKRNHFIGLSISFSDRVEDWKKMPRTITKVGKEAVTVYKHKATKVPSQRAIFEKMLSDNQLFANTSVPKTRVAQFLDETLKIQDNQRKIRDLVLATDEHDLLARRKEITSRTAKIQLRIASWRKMQKELMPLVGDIVAAQALASPAVHEEKLFLPSDFTGKAERYKLKLDSLALEEIRWREGQVFDSLRAIQNIVKTISALQGRKIKNDRQQKQNTRAGDNIEEAIKLRNQHMQSYEHARQRLLALNANSTYPPLNDEDLYMKPVLQKRRVGDSQHTDGALWRIYPQMPPDEVLETCQTMQNNTDCEEMLKYGKCTGNLSTTGTQMDRRRTGSTRTRSTPSQAPKKTVDERPDGWLWQLGKLCKMTDAEMDAWSHEGEDTFDGLFHTYLTLPEGDRVQWFRAEAEMQRWQEQCEQKLAELLRTNRSFLKMADTWTTVASQTAAACGPGHSAYAKQKAAIYHRRAEAAQALITAAGYGDLLGPNANLVDRVQKERDQEARVISDRLCPRD
ncbi:hypothetical protein C8R45DRAFT_923990 [Mycena sanguinolenta]|nr:hypothetical protein C8R45DRAFT_923990 [Mycena sanguinolenta]